MYIMVKGIFNSILTDYLIFCNDYFIIIVLSINSKWLIVLHNVYSFGAGSSVVERLLDTQEVVLTEQM